MLIEPRTKFIVECEKYGILPGLQWAFMHAERRTNQLQLFTERIHTQTYIQIRDPITQTVFFWEL